MDPAITSFLTIVGAGAASYFGAYIKRKGEDRAVREGFAEVLRQTKETTEATKKIEAKISDEVWDRQKRWELKRDVALELVKRIAALDDALMNYEAFVDLDKKRQPQGGELDVHWAEKKLETTLAWSKTSAEFDVSRAIVDTILSPEVKKTTDDLAKYAKLAGIKLSRGEIEKWAEYQMEVFQRIKKTKVAIRRELGLTATSQSNESSAAPGLAPPNPEAT
jgi:hypothetical protein